MFNNKNTLVVFGDSNVWGAELKDVPTKQPEFKSVVYASDDVANWPYHIRYNFTGLIAQQYEMNILNLAIPGCSNDTIFRRIHNFVRGKHSVDLNDCFAMVFWTGVNRREFYRTDLSAFLNYCPSWPSKMQLFPRFHSIYTREFAHNKYDINKTLNYIESINALFNYKNIDFVQGYSLNDKKLAKEVKKYQIPNFISYDPNDAISSLPIIKGNSMEANTNKYICEQMHPSELGHEYIKDTYLKYLDNTSKT